MQAVLLNILTTAFSQDIAKVRLLSMFVVLIGGLVFGYLAGRRLKAPEKWAKKIMTLCLVSFNWIIALFVIWKMNLKTELIWLPIICVVLMLVITTISALIFSLLQLDRRSRLTLVLAGGLSNLGYTGGAFVCYALFGKAGLAMANIYPLLWFSVVFLVFFPLLKLHEFKVNNIDGKFKFNDIFDNRLIIVPVVIIAAALNLSGAKSPRFIAKLYLIDILVYIASSLAFFAIGLQVKLTRLKDYINLYFILSVIKFILTPAAAILVIWTLNLAGIDLSDMIRNVVIVLSLTPSAVLMVTMSSVFDLNGPLASALWVVTTAVFAAFVAPLLFLIYT